MEMEQMLRSTQQLEPVQHLVGFPSRPHTPLRTILETSWTPGAGFQSSKVRPGTWQ
jgi:hypothetical protein